MEDLIAAMNNTDKLKQIQQ